MKKISCIIPAYNEQKNIANVLRAVTAVDSSIIGEIIVIDDCSKDNTREIVRGFPEVKLIALESNGGKSRAVATGIYAAKEEIVMMLDADLLNLEAKDIEALAAPIMNNAADVVISIRKNSPLWMKILQLDFMSGERIFPKKIMVTKLDSMLNLRGFGLEVFLNQIFIEHNCRLATVKLSNVKNDFKWSKGGFWDGIRREFLMWVDILKTISPWEFADQNIALKRLIQNKQAFRKVNIEYLNLLKELPLFAYAYLTVKRQRNLQSSRILLVNTCLIGEFINSIPAIVDFIEKNKGKQVDMLVSPSQRELAEKIRGIGDVFIAQSVYHRKNEQYEKIEQKFGQYDQLIILRVSSDAYNLIKQVATREVRTNFLLFNWYFFHLIFAIIFKHTPNQWIKMNFEMLNGEYRKIPFGQLFDFGGDSPRLKTFDFLNTDSKKILIHSNSGWMMKQWSSENWVELLNKIHSLGGYDIIFIGSSEDEENFQAIASRLGFQPYSLIGKVTLLELIQIMRRADYFIGVDSGPGNMAHCADLRSIIIFGPGPHMYLPYDDRDIAIDKTNGRGIIEMYLARDNGFIHQIHSEEVFESFKQLTSRK